MIYRVKQFFRGLFSNISDDDIKFIEQYLSESEKNLFNRLPNHEKRHAINTAISICKLCTYDNYLIKAGLLHDIGKVDSNMGIIKKSILVLMNKFLPSLSIRLSHKIKMFYIYYNHPDIGAEILKGLGTDKKVVELVRHHGSNKNLNIDGLDILRKADNLN